MQTMQEKLCDTLSQINLHLRQNAFLNAIESQSIQSIMLPILDALGWDFINPKEVQREYPIKGKRADIVLFLQGVPCVLIEAKAIGGIDAGSKKQAHFYGKNLEVDIPIVIVTDGQEWFFYTLKNGEYEESPCSLNIREMPHTDCADIFCAFLSRENVASKKSLSNIATATNQLSVYNDPLHPESKAKIIGVVFRGKEYHTRPYQEHEFPIDSIDQVYMLALELFAQEDENFLNRFKRTSQLRGGGYRIWEKTKRASSKNCINSGWQVTCLEPNWTKVLFDAACAEAGIVYNNDLRVLTKPKA